MHDLANNIKAIQAVVPAAKTADGASDAIDLAGYKSVVVLLEMGAITDGTWGMELSECDTAAGTFTAVDNKDLIGLEPTGLITGDGKGGSALYAVGYKGSKRYIVATVKEEVASTTGAVAGITVLLGHPNHAPVA